ncbi:hypothetical protein OK016_15690 [Vibrio chagasii]|nr:hypothetical protein [Vibrio chagasii]
MLMTFSLNLCMPHLWSELDADTQDDFSAHRCTDPVRLKSKATSSLLGLILKRSRE